MSTHALRAMAAACGLLLSAAAWAQAAARPDPLNPRAEVPPVVHRSALAAYRSAIDVPLGSWKDANDTVTRIGGWRTYLREAAQPDASGAPAPAPAATPAAPAAAPAATPPARPAAGHQHHGRPHGKP